MKASTLESQLLEELQGPLWPEIEALGEALRSAFPPGCVEAVVFYGSCLRDRTHKDRVVDFYAIVSSYGAAYPGRLAARAGNALLPPNVYFLECPFAGETLRAKYAVVSRRDFMQLTSHRALHPYLWGRFAQPVRLVGAVEDAVSLFVARCLGEASVTLQRSALPLMAEDFTADELWERALAESYRTEFRAESRNRAKEIFQAGAERYREQTACAVAEGRLAASPLGEGGYRRTGSGGAARAKLVWLLRRIVGRSLHVLRLLKGAFTYRGGLDYLLWKIARHSGVVIQPSEWQRRHPILAAPSLVWRLWRRGAFR